MPRFTDEEKEAVERLIPYAKRKTFVADLLINGHNARTPVNMRVLMRYAAGESGGTYIQDVLTFLNLMIRGVETDEMIGWEKMDDVYDLGSEAATEAQEL